MFLVLLISFKRWSFKLRIDHKNYFLMQQKHEFGKQVDIFLNCVVLILIILKTLILKI